MIKLKAKSPQKVFVTSAADIEKLGNELSQAKIVLIGEAVLGVFDSKEDSSEIGVAVQSSSPNLLNEYVPQRTRSASNIVDSLLGKKGNLLKIYANKDVVLALQKAGVKERSVYIAADSVLRFIKFATFKKTGVILCVSAVKAKFGSVSYNLVEEYRFANGELTSFSERRYDISIFTSEINKSLNEAIRSFSAELNPEVFVCGPEADKAISAIQDFKCINKNKEIFTTFVAASFTYELIAKEKVLPFIGAVSLSIVVAVIMALSGKSQLDKAQSEYRASIAGFEEIYDKGRAPVELVEKRARYMAEIEQQRKTEYKLPLIISAIAKVKSASPDLDVVATEITYHNNNSAEIKREEDYKVILRFIKKPALTPQEELQQWQNVFMNFSKEMDGNARVIDTPQVMSVTSEQEVFLMTIVGNFEVRT